MLAVIIAAIIGAIALFIHKESPTSSQSINNSPGANQAVNSGSGTQVNLTGTGAKYNQYTYYTYPNNSFCNNAGEINLKPLSQHLLLRFQPPVRTTFLLDL